MENILVIKELVKKFGKKTVLDGLNLEIKQGAIYGIVGNNGVGKTTLLRIVLGFLKQDNGTVEFAHDYTGNVGSLIEAPGLFEDMTAYQNMKAKALCMGYKTKKPEIIELLQFVGLDGKDKKRVKKFSMGMKQRLAIALALLGDPELLILDEPTNGLDPQGIIEIRQLILKAHKEKGVTIMVSSHILDELAKLATDFCIIKAGKVLKTMTVDELNHELNGKDINEYYVKLISE